MHTFSIVALLPFSMSALAITALLLLLPCALSLEFAPCHSNRRTQGDGSKCEVISIPRKLCKVCKLNPLGTKGSFPDCEGIYDINSACRKQLRKYARMNPCDKVRNDHIKDITNPLSVKGLDYFVYSVCEECCDCIPRGTNKITEYADRKKKDTLIKVDRANCATHLHFDVCKVWPDVRYVKKPKQKVPADVEKNWPKICPIVANWKDNFKGPLFNVDEVVIPDSMVQFLDRLTDVLPCKERTVWEECFKLEDAQNRI